MSDVYYIWRCNRCGNLHTHGTVEEPFPNSRPFCHGSDELPRYGGHDPVPMERIEVVPKSERDEALRRVERLERALDRAHGWIGNAVVILPSEQLEEINAAQNASVPPAGEEER